MDPNLSEPGKPEADQQQQPAAAPRGLKIAVVVMGVILIVGFLAVFITIAYRVANPRAPVPGEGPAGYDLPVALSAGAEISGIEFTGERALLTVTGPDGAQSLIVLDTERGRTIGRFTLQPE